MLFICDRSTPELNKEDELNINVLNLVATNSWTTNIWSDFELQTRGAFRFNQNVICTVYLHFNVRVNMCYLHYAL